MLNSNSLSVKDIIIISDSYLHTGSLKDDWFKELDRAQENYRESYNIFKQLNDKTNAALVLLNETNSFEVKAKIIRSVGKYLWNTNILYIVRY